ncbi:hypothetical protein OIE66_19775 [Nonomuraea sp. NBC_01738]|uniref:hypothetical protein n=1 Tax=Nonomuraea sp. NBC_01738 TaxID=2976003 RepID=UPI002E1086BA|nr:hypothetical protein OIE66_19775 [Nonomuraea sp. NBC_01738]
MSEDNSPAPAERRVAEAVADEVPPDDLDQSDADRVAGAEAAPEPEPPGSQEHGRFDDGIEGNPELAVHRQLLWGGGLSENRLDRELPPDDEQDRG